MDGLVVCILGWVDGSLKWIASTPDGYDQYEGTFASPNFQQGTPPYLTEGGGIKFDAQGVPQNIVVEGTNQTAAAKIADAVSKLRYQAGTLNGQSYEFPMVLKFDLR